MANTAKILYVNNFRRSRSRNEFVCFRQLELVGSFVAMACLLNIFNKQQNIDLMKLTAKSYQGNENQNCKKKKKPQQSVNGDAAEHPAITRSNSLL